MTRPGERRWRVGAEAMRRWLEHSELALPLLILALQLLLVTPFFFPSLAEINPWDEAAYIDSGRRFFEGTLPSLGGNPLVSLLYALLYAVTRDSPFWLVLSCWMGRLILFLLLWSSSFSVGRSLRRFFPAVLLPGLLLVLPMSLEMLTFPSDPLFAALAGFSLANMIRFESTGEARHVGLASAWMGLAALARSDGLVLWLILCASALVLSLRSRRIGSTLLASTVPLLLIVGSYVVAAGIQRGNFNLGILERTYENFESGQQAVFSGPGDLNPVIEAREEARRLFGTPEENRYSVLRAIRRNPAAYQARLITALRALPESILRAYGTRFAAILFTLALRGAIELALRKELRLLGLLLIWPAHLATGLPITLFRSGHLQFPFLIVLSLACLGLVTVIRRLAEGKERTLAGVGVAVWIAYGWFGNKLAVFYGAVILGAGLFLGVWTFRRHSGGTAAWTAAFLGLLAAGLVLHGNYPSPRIPQVGLVAEERALTYMVETLPAGSWVAAGSPGVVWAARMRYAGLASTDIPLLGSPEEFVRWMEDSGFRAVYVDSTLSSENPRVWDLIAAQVGGGLTRGFQAEEGNIQVLLVKASPDS